MFFVMTHLVEIFWVFVAVAVPLLATLAAKRLVSGNKSETVEQSCKTCVHWDLDEGQAEIRQNVMFASAVAPHVSPSRMMQRFGTDGEPLKNDVKVKASTDNWNSFGLCNVVGDDDHKKCTHCDYKCVSYRAKS